VCRGGDGEEGDVVLITIWWVVGEKSWYKCEMG